MKKAIYNTCIWDIWLNLVNFDSAGYHVNTILTIFMFSLGGHNHCQSELPQSIPRNSVGSDHGCTSRIYFDNANDNVMLTLYNVTLTSQKPC